MCLLGSMILDPEVIDDVATLVTRSEAFYKVEHATIFDRLVALHRDRKTTDIVQLLQALKDGGTLEGVGGESYIVQLAESVPSAANATHYARTVIEKARRRALITSAGAIMLRAYDQSNDDEQLIAEAEQDILSVGEDGVTRDAKPLSEVIGRSMAAGEDRQNGVGMGIPTGIASLDAMIIGLRPCEMVVLAARPSMGKSTLALNIARNIAVQGTPVVVYSLEMNDVSIADRLLCAEADVTLHDWLAGTVGYEHAERIGRAERALSSLPLYISECPGASIQSVRSMARRMVRRRGVGVVMIDYLQLLCEPSVSAHGRTQEVSAISRGVKAMAMENRVPVVCLSQINRMAEHRSNHRPTMSDLRESGAIEQDADCIVLLHREAYYHKDEPEWEVQNGHLADLAELIVSKQRNGRTGVALSRFDGAYQRFISHGV